MWAGLEVPVPGEQSGEDSAATSQRGISFMKVHEIGADSRIWSGSRSYHTSISKLPVVHHQPLGNAASSLQDLKVKGLTAGTHYHVHPPAGTQGDPLPL